MVAQEAGEGFPPGLSGYVGGVVEGYISLAALEAVQVVFNNILK